MYGKLVDGKLIYAPISIDVGDKCIINPTDAEYIAAGYKAISNGLVPAILATQKLLTSYTETDTEIQIVYSVVNLSDEEIKSTYKNMCKERIHENWDDDKEKELINLGIADKTNADYVAYRTTVESIKTEVKKELGIEQ